MVSECQPLWEREWTVIRPFAPAGVKPRVRAVHRTYISSFRLIKEKYEAARALAKEQQRQQVEQLAAVDIDGNLQLLEVAEPGEVEDGDEIQVVEVPLTEAVEEVQVEEVQEFQEEEREPPPAVDILAAAAGETVDEQVEGCADVESEECEPDLKKEDDSCYLLAPPGSHGEGEGVQPTLDFIVYQRAEDAGSSQDIANGNENPNLGQKSSQV